MDIATIAGVSLGIVIMLASIMIGGAPFSVFIDLPSILCVVGGAACSVLICYPLRAVKLLPFSILKTVVNRSPPTQQIINQIVSLAEFARRDGLLALEPRLEAVSNNYIKLGLQMAIDGTKPEVIEDVMKTEIAALAARHSLCKGVIDQLGKYSPAFGMIGTLLGLVMMLNNMSDPSAIGRGMAVALLTTLYGAVLSNLFFLPMSEKLGFYNREEIQSVELILRGVMAIQSGENPRLIEQKLQAVLHPKNRHQSKAA
jgi:chemotaxis protein MotA